MSWLQYPSSHAPDIAQLVAELLVEAAHLGVVGAHEEIDLPDAMRPEPRFRFANGALAVAAILEVRRHRQVIKHATMAVMTNHHAGDRRIAGNADQDLGIFRRAGEGNVLARVVPRPREPACLPQRHYRLD